MPFSLIVSAWIDRKRSASCCLAIRTRSSRRRNSSFSRVMKTSYLPSARSLSRSSVANVSVIAFSTVPFGPSAPPSMPPWPASMTTVNRWPARPVLPDAVALGRRLRRAGGFGLYRKRGVELAFRSSGEIGDQPVAGRRLVRQHVELVDGERPLGRQDQPRTAVAEVPVADALDQTPRLQILWVDGKSGVRQVDHQPVRPAQQEPFRVRLAVEIHHDAHMRRIAGHLVVLGFEREAGEGNGESAEKAENHAESPTATSPRRVSVPVRSSNSSPVALPHRSPFLARQSRRPDRRYRLLTSGIQIRLTKPFRRIVTLRKPICRHQKSGLPKTSANHKSDIGSLQCPETLSAAAPTV